MSLLASNIYDKYTSYAFKHNKFFYNYNLFLTSFVIIQLYTLIYLNDNIFPANEVTLYVNTTTVLSKQATAYLRNFMNDDYCIIIGTDAVKMLEIIKLDIFTSIFFNVFSIFGMNYVHFYYDEALLSLVLDDKFSIVKKRLIKYIAFGFYFLNVSYGIIVNRIWHVNTDYIYTNEMNLFVKTIYNYYYLKWVMFISTVSIYIVAIAIYRLIIKNIKNKISKNN